jgi:hypothetical protein
MTIRRGTDWKKVLKVKRSIATARPELRGPTSPRVPPASPTSMPVKAEDPKTRALIDRALKARQG